MKEKMMTVNEVCKLTGLSARTLHYYNEIGLLNPAVTTDSGYRMYDDACLDRLQDIMLFRELEFPLKEIKRIIDSKNFDRDKALLNQIRLLELKREHLDGLIKYAKEIRGEKTMSFKAFDKSKIEEYEKRAKENWGETAAYKEYEQKAEKTTEAEKRQAAEDLMDVFYEFGTLMDLNIEDEKVQMQVKKLQDFITMHYYTCTNQILAGLGQMYAAGGEMTENIDEVGGKGCAKFASTAIEYYCREK